MIFISATIYSYIRYRKHPKIAYVVPTDTIDIPVALKIDIPVVTDKSDVHAVPVNDTTNCTSTITTITTTTTIIGETTTSSSTTTTTSTTTATSTSTINGTV